MFPTGIRDIELRGLNQMAKDNRLMTTEELAKALDYGPRTIRKAAREGKIPVINLSRNLRFDPQAVREALLLSNTKKPKRS